MITVISGSNRTNTEAKRLARTYAQFLQACTEEEVRVLAMDDIPHDWFFPEMYSSDHQAKSLAHIQDEFLEPADKFVFIMPEYNGSYPGVVKLMIDACSVRDYKATFGGKKAALVGFSSGRAGNLRGMEHLTGVLNHVGITVLPNKLPISRIEQLSGENGLSDEATLRVLKEQAREFAAF